MKNTIVRCAALAVAVALLGGCATGAKYQDVVHTLQAPKAGEGRIYFLRSASFVGGALQPDIRLNGQVVGESKPGGFFYVDRPSGNYVAATATETEKTASFVLRAGETKYLRTSPSMGLIVGRVVVELESEDKALAELPSLSYTGSAAASNPTKR